MRNDRVDWVFEGSAAQATMALLDARALDETQLRQVRRRLERKGAADEE